MISGDDGDDRDHSEAREEDASSSSDGSDAGEMEPCEEASSSSERGQDVVSGLLQRRRPPRLGSARTRGVGVVKLRRLWSRWKCFFVSLLTVEVVVGWHRQLAANGVCAISMFTVDSTGARQVTFAEQVRLMFALEIAMFV
jgi:hypothetical protein